MKFRKGDKITLDGWGDTEYLVVSFACEEFDWFRTEPKKHYEDSVRYYKEGWKLKN